MAVRELDKDDLRKVNIFAPIVIALFNILKRTIHIENINYPEDDSKVIFALWHADQCAIHGVPYERHGKVHILISKSMDGEIIARGVESLGFKTIRGSENRIVGTSIVRDKGGVGAALQMQEVLNAGDSVAIMVDGPKGPVHRVKNGIINTAKHTGARIIPLVWYSAGKSFVHLPTWDKMTFPIGFTKFVNMYGDPILVPADSDKENDEKIKEQIKKSLEDLAARAPEEWNNIYRKKKKKN